MLDNKIKTEFLAGLTTFLTMSYIIIVNPLILSTEGTGMSHSGVLTATVLLSFSMTLFMGLYAKLPFAIAPGMGLNAFFTYHIILGQNVPWQTALGAVFWSGILFLLISVTPLREMIAKALPKSLRLSAACGIGLFLTFIGLKSAGLVVASPATLVKLGSIGLPQLCSVVGLFVIVYFLQRKSAFAFLIGMGLVTILGVISGNVNIPQNYFSLPDFTSVAFKLDIWGAMKLSLLPTIVSIMFTDMFDSISTFVGVSHAGNLLDEKGEPKNLRQGLIVDSVATVCSGLLGTSSGTAFIESASGIKIGGKTGLTSVFTSLFFLPCLFLAPLVGMVPPFATAPVLIVLGAMMFASVKELEIEKYEDLVPAFLTLILIPLTFSITQGMLWGMVAHVVCYSLAGRRREIKNTMWMLALVSITLLFIENKFK